MQPFFKFPVFYHVFPYQWRFWPQLFHFSAYSLFLISRMGVLEMAVRSMAEAVDLMLVSYCLFLLSLSFSARVKTRLKN